MISRRFLIGAGLALTAAAVLPAMSAAGAGSAPASAYIRSATAITQVFGAGQRLVGVAIEYDRPVDAALVDAGLYAVETRRVTRVYASGTPQLASGSGDPALNGTGRGSYVIVELAAEDATAPLYRTLPGGGIERLPAAATVSVRLPGAPPAPPEGEKGPPAFGSQPLDLPTRRAVNLVVDDFSQDEFLDPETGDRLAYNLYVPPQREAATALPLVIFLHDAGATSTIVDTTLVQGLGAVSWAGPEDQGRHPAIVLAPQYAAQIVNDSSEASSFLDTTLHLIERIAAAHNVDRRRIYATGQSGGGMLSIAMMIRQPELFAAAFLVACQWDPAVVAPLARQKLWVMVSEGDAKAYPGQNAIMEVIAAAGTAVSRTMWDGTSLPEVFADSVARQAAAGAPVNYTVLRKGSVVPPGQPDDPGSNHINTWRIAYAIAGIRDWIMAQTRPV